MSSPYEELEQLADQLPEEGESLLVSRRGGELVCEPVPQESVRAGLTDAELYGRLVQANERLESLSRLPLWSMAALLFLVSVGFHWLSGIDWRGWWVDVAALFVGVFVSTRWIQIRQWRYFQTRIMPGLEHAIRQRHLKKFVFLGAVRQHAELRTLMDLLVHWE